MSGLSRVIISGGGSGGHVFPAISIANALKEKFPQLEILFVGAKGKIEMIKVPQSGYEIQGLWISGLQRSLTWRNLLFPFKVLHSLWNARIIIRRFHPQIAVGVGGYASGPTLAMASRLGIPTLIQEQNSYAGLTNKWLSKRVDRICVAYDGMQKYFPREKIVMTGNPVRSSLRANEDKLSAFKHFGLDPSLKTILIIGGSLGAKTLNVALRDGYQKVSKARDIQFIWQQGELYKEEFGKCETTTLSNVAALTFIDRMDLAYQCADLVVCRAGALTISELCLLAMPTILVPSPNVAEDHQTKNALALVQKNAAIMIADHVADKKLLDTAMEIIHDDKKLSQLASSIAKLGKPRATEDIVNQIVELAKL